MEVVTLELTVDEVNLLLVALGDRKANEVFDLIVKIKREGEKQLKMQQ